MSIIDANSLPPRTTLETDICIVGAGVAGITLAAALARSASREVCLIESGGEDADPETQSLYDLENSGYPMRENYMSRARYFGGSSNLWAGRNMVLSRFDLRPRPWVPESGWPISHAEIAAHYAEACRILGLSSIECFDSNTHRAGLSPSERDLFHSDVLVPTVSMWARRPTRFGTSYRRRLRTERNVRVILKASVIAIHLNDSGKRVESVTAATLAGHRLRVRARVFVLACGGLENARLLLVSRDRERYGIGNRHDRVGRYFMEHPRAVFGTVRLHPSTRLSLLRGLALRDGKVQFGIGLSPAVQERERLLNHYVTLESQFSGYTEARYQSFVQAMKVLLRRGHAGSRWDFARANLSDLPSMIYLLSPKEIMPHTVYRWYSVARRLLPSRADRHPLVVVYFCEQPPDPESRVTLCAKKDRLGLNRLELHWRIGDEVERSVLGFQALLQRELRSRGLGELAPGDDLTFTDASHHMGTTRMSETAKEGVVDTDCRVHGVANLYVAGSSVFPSVGHANPTLTIVALALRLAGHLRDGEGRMA